MKTATILAVLSLFGANLQSTMATPTVKVPRAGQAKSWEFFLFQDPHCTGPRDQFMGNGTTACRNDVRDAHTSGFMKGRLSPNCVITLFQGQNCTQSIQNITSQVEDTCQGLPTQINSFNAHCFRPHFMFKT